MAEAMIPTEVSHESVGYASATIHSGPHSRVMDAYFIEPHPFHTDPDLVRAPFFFSDEIPSEAGYGRYFHDSNFRTYRPGDVFVLALKDAVVLGSDGIVLTNGAYISDTARFPSHWLPDSMVADISANTIKLKAKVNVPQTKHGRCYLGFTAGWRNHAHWITENVPRLLAYGVLRDRMPDLKILLPRFGQNSAQHQALEYFGIRSGDVEILDHHTPCIFDNLYMLSALDIWSVSSLTRDAARQMMSAMSRSGPSNVKRRQKIYIRRNRATTVRHVKNYDDLVPVLERYGIETVEFESLSLSEQVAHMRQSDLVVAEHGAALGNLAFCTPGAVCLELFNPMTVQPAHWSLASLCSISYGYLVGAHAPTEKYPNLDWNSDYHIDPQKLEVAIARAESIPSRQS